MIIVRFTSSPPSLEFFLYYSQIFKIIIPSSVSTEYLLRQRLFRQYQCIASKKLEIFKSFEYSPKLDLRVTF